MGQGEIECSSCDGTGRAECEYCDGTGEIEHDDSTEECDDCDGRGEVRCPECYSGKAQCEECEGAGELESDEKIYYNYFLVTWNQNIIDKCELNVNTIKPIMSEETFLTDTYQSQTLVLHLNESHMEFSDYLRPGMMYCNSIEDEPNLGINLITKKLFNTSPPSFSHFVP